MSALACHFSPDRRHRYSLWRVWDEANRERVLFVGLNPSTADDTQDDPTIRRCVGFAKSWGLGGLCMANLFAFRATSPAVMKAARDPIGIENDVELLSLTVKCSLVVACWGTHGAHLERGTRVANMLRSNFPSRKLFCLGINADGSPKHPLYLRKDIARIEFKP